MARSVALHAHPRQLGFQPRNLHLFGGQRPAPDIAKATGTKGDVRQGQLTMPAIYYKKLSLHWTVEVSQQIMTSGQNATDESRGKASNP